MNLPVSLRAGVSIGCMIAVACLLFAVLTMCQGSKTQHAKLQTENVTGRALDKATTQTQAINADAKDKQHEADQIPGANDRLPDGYADSLQRVRDGKRHNP